MTENQRTKNINFKRKLCKGWTVVQLLFLIGFFFNLANPPTVFAQNSCSSTFDTKAYPSKSFLDDKLFAVHLTDFFPKDGILKAFSEGKPLFRTTVHFSLGEPVRSHSMGSWSNKKYAILLPIKYLKDQMLNLFTQDTFILGDFLLPNKSIILVPMGESLPNEFPGRVLYYDLKVGIEESVRQIIKKEGGIELTGKGADEKDDTFYREEAIIPDIFFKDYFKSQKHLSKTLHAKTAFGKIDYGIYRILSNWFYAKQNVDLKWQDLEVRLLYIAELLIQIKDDIEKMNLPPIALNSYQRNLTNLYGFLNIVEADINIQKEYGKSFLNSNGALHNEILALRENRTDLKKFLFQNLEKFSAVSEIESWDRFVTSAARELLPLDYDHFVNAVRKQKFLMYGNSESFEYEYLILEKAIDSYLSGKLSIEPAVEQFEKMVEFSDELQISRILNNKIRKIPLSDRHTFIRDPMIFNHLKDIIHSVPFNLALGQ